MLVRRAHGIFVGWVWEVKVEAKLGSEEMVSRGPFHVVCWIERAWENGP